MKPAILLIVLNMRRENKEVPQLGRKELYSHKTWTFKDTIYYSVTKLQ